MKNGIKALLVLLFIVLHSFPAVSQKKAKLNRKVSVKESFEETDYLKNWAGTEKCCPSSVERTDSFARTGKYSLKIELGRENLKQTHNYRSELKLDYDAGMLAERWYKFSFLLPSYYEVDSATEILAQWHDVPDRRLGESWRSPAISLRVNNGHWELMVLWSENKVNTNKSISGKKVFDLGKIEKGKWTDWIFDIKFSYKNDGHLKVWKNSQKIVDYTGPNYYNDENGPYFKIGIYKWEWGIAKTKSKSKKRVFYIDDVEVCDANCNFVPAE